MEDLRKVKSRDALRKAFWSVLETKKYSMITIKDIVETAGLNRKTFNAHYENIEALMNDCIQELLEGLRRHFQVRNADGSPDFAGSVRAYTKFTLDHRDRLSLLFDNNLDSVALRYWRNKSRESVKTDNPTPDLQKEAIRQDLFGNYATYCCWGNLLWVLDHADDMPFEKLVDEALLVYRIYLENYLALYHD